jgi:endonuclease/exonuclease/phosphatase family metal-dependent hydrolase
LFIDGVEASGETLLERKARLTKLLGKKPAWPLAYGDHWQRDCGLRIDHLLLTPDLRKRLSGAGVERWVRDQPHASDHAPTWIEFKTVSSPRKGRKRKAAA